MEDVVQKVHETPMASLRPNAFQDLESRLSAVRQILDGSLNLPQEDPDMTSLLEDMKKRCATVTPAGSGILRVQKCSHPRTEH